MKIKLTKNELKTQKEGLKRFNRYLPMLQLKKQQLQIEISKIYHAIENLSCRMDDLRKALSVWVDLFAEEIGWGNFFRVSNIKTTTGNIAGIDIPIFLDVAFEETEYDLLAMPLWVDRGMEVCKEMIVLKAKLLICHKQRDILRQELRITTQRVNLFEKVKIPESKENIRIINIYLGDLHTAEVVRGKIAKAKIEKREGNNGKFPL